MGTDTQGLRRWFCTWRCWQGWSSHRAPCPSQNDKAWDITACRQLSGAAGYREAGGIEERGLLQEVNVTEVKILGHRN